MWKSNGNRISMAEGDYGIPLPITVAGVTIGSGDEISFTVKTAVNGTTILTKTFSDISGDSVDLTLTSAESALFEVGEYVYALDLYHEGTFMCNLIPANSFRVVDKA